MSENVGLFIDFENLIYGLVDRYGEQGAYELFKTQIIFEFSQRYGQISRASAYADWRMRAVNQWQVDLYGRGVDLVHVLGRGGKNAVDIKMAVDLVESVFVDDLITTYVVVSGDRDFLPAIKLLKRRGKRVIALSPSRAMSREMKRVCDVAVSYERLINELGELEQPKETSGLDNLLSEVLDLTEGCGDAGLTGAQLKQMILQSRGGGFSERDYGCISFGSLLERLADRAQTLNEARGAGERSRELILTRPPQGDLRVHVAFTYSEVGLSVAEEESGRRVRDVRERAEPSRLDLGDSQSGAQGISPDGQRASRARAHELQLALSSLKGYQYIQSASRRREILSALYQALSLERGVSWAEAIDGVCATAQISRSQASKYHAILLQSQAFTPVDESDDRPVKHRSLKLIEELKELNAFIERYERSILHKVVSRRGGVSIELSADLLGVDPKVEREYLLSLLSLVSGDSVDCESET